MKQSFAFDFERFDTTFNYKNLQKWNSKLESFSKVQESLNLEKIASTGIEPMTFHLPVKLR
jgi:hypothetical protein